LKKCPICEGSDVDESINLKDYRVTKEEFSLRHCNYCDFIFTHNPPSPEKIGPYYDSEDYLEHSNKREGLFSRLYHFARAFMLHYKYRIISGLSKEKELLDIGAGSGQFLNFMKSKGYQVDGIELNEKAREFARENYNLSIYTADKLYEKGALKNFDIISLWHVLEHLYDLNKVVTRIEELLKPNGVLIVAVPNHKSHDARYFKKHWAAWDVPRHLWHFSPKNMKYLFEKHGFEVSKMKGMPFDPFFNTLLSAKYRNGTSILNLFTMIIRGFIALLVGLFDTSKASSIIYILRKKTN